ncbi:MAG: VWA domain-containing protein [Pseudomonadota bacterium]
MSIRRLPTYLLIDTSGSMNGEPIQAVNIGVRAMLASLRQNPFALESVYLSVITFDGKVNELLPLTALDSVSMPEIVCPPSGPTFLGEALHALCDQVEREVRKSGPDQKGDWRPLLFIMTDGKASDTQAFEEAVPRVKQAQFATIVACAAGPKSVPDQLKQLTDKVVSLDTMDSNAFSSFFQWVSSMVGAGSSASGAPANMDLPPPPPEVQVLL